MRLLQKFVSIKSNYLGRLKAFIRLSGFDIIRYLPSNLGINPYQDMRFFLDDTSDLNIVDAGANLGESTSSLLDFFPKGNYYLFEPCIDTYTSLIDKLGFNQNITIYNLGLSDNCTEINFNLNEFNYLSSYLDLGAYGYGKILRSYASTVITLDSFRLQKKLSIIHVLKIDVGGFELNVLKGCESLLEHNCIKLVHVQIILTEIYKPIPSFMEIFNLLLNNNFILIGIYRQHFQGNQLSWADALFLNKYF